MIKFPNKILYFCKNIYNKGFKLTLPAVYLFLLVFSFVISAFYRFTPFLYVCPNLFGQEVCAPLGVYIGLLVSYPGYFAVAYGLASSEAWTWELSLGVVIAITVLVYFLVGLFLDKYLKSNKNNKIKLLIIATFALLSVIFITLLSSL